MAATVDEYAAALALLPDKRRRFVIEYLLDQNATAAAKRAGYAAGSAHVTGSRLLKDAKVRAAVAAGLASRAEAVEVTAEEVVRELKRIAFADLRRAVKWGAGTVTLLESDELDADIAAAIVEVSQGEHGVKIKLAPKIVALGHLGKVSGAFRQDDDAREASERQILEEIEAGRGRALPPPVRVIAGPVLENAPADD